MIFSSSLGFFLNLKMVAIRKTSLQVKFYGFILVTKNKGISETYKRFDSLHPYCEQLGINYFNCGCVVYSEKLLYIALLRS